MESLLANYVSSDEEEEKEAKPSSYSSSLSKPSFLSCLPPPKISSSSSSSLFSSLPPPSSQVESIQPIESKQTRSVFSSLPPPKIPSSSSSSLFSSVPPPKSQQVEESQAFEENPKRFTFSSVPPPKSKPAPDSNPRKVVQFTLPLNPSLLKPDDFDDEDEEEEERKPVKDSSDSLAAAAPTRVSSRFPAPKNSIGVPRNASSRRSAFDSSPHASSRAETLGTTRQVASSNIDGYGSPKVESFEGGEQQHLQQESGNFEEYGSYPLEQEAGGAGSSKVESFEGGEQQHLQQESGNFEEYGSYPLAQEAGGAGSSKAESFEGGEQQHLQQESGNFEDYGRYPLEQEAGGYENYGSYDRSCAANGSADASYASSYQSGSYENYGSYGGNMSGVNEVAVSVPVVHEMERIVGKRGRREIPTEIVEVTQAELMKNRPREDQVKSTGIAFGPAYQAVSSSKGKPSKLHKRKHQIGSLFFDMKQKETELAERRSRGLLTKAETHAKYGW